MRSRKSASRLFLGTFLEFVSCKDESESVKIVIPREVGKLLRSIFNRPKKEKILKIQKAFFIAWKFIFSLFLLAK